MAHYSREEFLFLSLFASNTHPLPQHIFTFLCISNYHPLWTRSPFRTHEMTYIYIFFYPPPCSTSLSNNITVQHTDSNTFLQLNSIRISCSYFVGGLCEAVCGCFCFSFTSFDSGWLGMLCVCVF